LKKSAIFRTQKRKEPIERVFWQSVNDEQDRFAGIIKVKGCDTREEALVALAAIKLPFKYKRFGKVI